MRLNLAGWHFLQGCFVMHRAGHAGAISGATSAAAADGGCDPAQRQGPAEGLPGRAGRALPQSLARGDCSQPAHGEAAGGGLVAPHL